MTSSQNNLLVRAVIALLALADGTIHLALDFVLFRGNLIGSPFPSGGGAPSSGSRSGLSALPLNELFLLNFIGAVVLVVLFWFANRWLGARRWLMNIVLIAYEVTTFVAWVLFGRPNPMGLGYLSKSIEVVLVVILVAYTVTLVRSLPRTVPESPVRAGR